MSERRVCRECNKRLKADEQRICKECLSLPKIEGTESDETNNS